MKSSTVETLILELLSSDQAHLAAQEIYSRLQARLPALNPSTVYRALDRLALAGKVSVSHLGTGATVFESVTNGMHHHLVCQHCHRVSTVPDSIVQPFFHRLEQEYQFQVTTNHLVLFGYCEACQHASQ